MVACNLVMCFIYVLGVVKGMIVNTMNGITQSVCWRNLSKDGIVRKSVKRVVTMITASSTTQSFLCSGVCDTWCLEVFVCIKCSENGGWSFHGHKVEAQHG